MIRSIATVLLSAAAFSGWVQASWSGSAENRPATAHPDDRNPRHQAVMGGFLRVGSAWARWLPAAVLVEPEPVPPISPSLEREVRAFWGLTFDGNDYLTIGDATWAAAGLNAGTGSFTYMAWVKTTATVGAVRYVGTKRTTRGWSLIADEFSPTGTPVAYAKSTGEARVTAASVLTANTWTHLAMVLDRGVDSLYLYVNGVRSGTPKSTAGVLTLDDASATAYIGQSWQGSIALARYGLVARTPTQVASDMLVGLQRIGWESFWPFLPGWGQSATEILGGPAWTLGSTTGDDANDPTWTGPYRTITTQGPL